MNKFQDFKKIHFIGIGGIGMSALAGLLLKHGKEISGSDRSLSKITKDLSDKGVKVFNLESKSNIDSSCDLVIYTPAVSEEHPEILTAKSLGIKIISYPEALGLISEEFFTVAVSGTHGKTTTTAMIIHVLDELGRSPNAIVGSLIKGKDGNEDSNFRFGKEDIFIVEACEYKRSFLKLSPDVLVINNIEEDHLDYYKNISDIKDSFRDFVQCLPKKGVLISSFDKDNVGSVISAFKGSFIDFKNYNINGTVFPFGGEHNRSNAQTAIAVLDVLGISTKESINSLKTFPGTWRRFEYKGKTKKGAMVFDDYAHHPSEVLATIKAAKEKYPDKNINIVFQPHLYSRLSFFFNDFINSLSGADVTVLTPVYQARDEDNSFSYSSDDLFDALVRRGRVSYKVSSLRDAVKKVLEISDIDSIVIMMGAGDIYTKTLELVEKNEPKVIL